MYYIKYKHWWSTKHFQQAGRDWLRDTKYCPFDQDSEAYREYWDEQKHYIQNGFTYEGQRISGLYYLYLNFCPIKRKRERKMSIPDFWSMDADYFDQLEYLMGLTPSMTKSERDFRPVGLSIGKTRQCGASLKGAVPALYMVNFVPFSFTYIGAWLEKDALKTLQMYMHYHNHLYKYTDFGKRWMERDQNKRYKTGYFEEVNGEKIPAGYQSELNIVTFLNNPEKGVGGGCDLFIIEEAAFHPALTQSITYIAPACKDGDYTTGNILAYGAASTETVTADFEYLHYHPDEFDFMSFKNIYDGPEPLYDTCGYFIPNYSCRPGHIDKDGNPNCETAIISRTHELAKLKKNNHEKYLEKLSQFPNSGKEMFGSRGRNRFDKALIDAAIKELIKSGHTGTTVDLFPDPDKPTGIGFRLNNKQAINQWPTPPGIDLNGSVLIHEFPSDDPVKNLYISSIDSYNQDDSQTTSLGCCYIYKKISNSLNENTNRVIVAEYIARPTDAFGKQTFYRTCAMLLQLYRAISLPENEDHELTPWFYTNGLDHLLADQPDIIRSVIPGSQVKRLKGIHADKNLIIAAENKIQRYLYRKIGNILNDEGKQVGERLGAHTIPSLGLLQELASYSNIGNKNYDRVRTFGWLLMYEEETINITPEEPENDEYADMLVNTDKLFRKKPLNSMYG